ncbi:MAG TPA: hypothetical protein VMV94_02130, partial [Phycisphaerae bacterium]|nr:hypothetical protein [Phycisphaerae bacterium]
NSASAFWYFSRVCFDDATAQLRALAELHNGTIPLNDPDLMRIEADLKQTREKYQKAEAEFWRQLGVVEPAGEAEAVKKADEP